MKNFTKIFWLLIIVSGSVSAQQERGIIGSNNWLNNWTEFVPNNGNSGETTHILSGNITEDTVLYKKHTYLLLGNVFVTNNAILSIEPGTVIMGDSQSKATLTITVGAAIIAEGTVTDPIVFTSNKIPKKAGDWGGIIILGDGHTNKFEKNSVTSYTDLKPSDYVHTNFGGDKLKDNSGFISYVRIEYAGAKSKNSHVSNALLLAGVGSKTTVNNVMVSYSAGNSVNVMGGDVTMSQMVSYKSKGTDYNFSYGATCNIYNALAVRSPYVSSNNESRCMNVVSYDNTNDVDFTKKGTEVRAKNMTLLTDSENVYQDSELGLIRESVYVGEHTNFSMDKSVISGFNKAVILDKRIKINDASLARMTLNNIYFNNCNGNIFSNLDNNNEDLENWYGNPAFFNLYSKTNHSELFINTDLSKKPDYRLRIDKIFAMNKVQKNN